MKSACRSLVALFALVGCTATENPAVKVTPQSVHAYAEMCSKAPSNLSPAGYVFAGFDFVDQQCQIFFDGVVELQKNSRYASSSIATGNTQAAVIMGVLKASASSIAVVAAGSEMARKLIDGYAEEYAFSPYTLEARRIVFDILKAYRDDGDTVRQISALSGSTGDNYCSAQNIVRNYAKICSLSNVEALARQAMASAKIAKSGQDSETAPRPTGGRLRPTSGSYSRGYGLPNFVVR